MRLSSTFLLGACCSLLALAAAGTACGARSAIDDADALGGGGAAFVTSSTGKTSTSTTASNAPTASSASTGVDVRCPVLAVDDPRIALDDGGTIFPEIGLLPNNHVLLTRASLGTLSLLGDEIDPFASWPPPFGAPTVLFAPVDTYTLGPGPDGPVAYLPQPNGAALMTRVWPAVEIADVPIATNAQARTVAGIQGRYFYGSGVFEMMDFGSYEPGGLPQVEEPLVCAVPSLAKAIPSGQGFLAAMGRPNPPEPACSSQVPQAARMITIARHDHAPGGPDMPTTLVDLIALEEPLSDLTITPTSFGAWVVYQTDGSTSRVPPGVRAIPILQNGQPRDPGSSPFWASPDGIGIGPIAATTLGDALVIAYVDAIDPSAPSIIVQRMEPDGTLTTSASVPTATAWLNGQIRLLASPARNAILVAWEGGLGTPVVGLARLSCVEGIK